MKKVLSAWIAIFIVMSLLSTNASEISAAVTSDVESITLKRSPFQVEDWTINGTFAINAPTSYVKGNNEYVAVGNYGTVMKSSDGVNWSAYSRFANYQFTAIAWNGENYIISGANTTYNHEAINRQAQLFISKDAVSWNKIEFDFDDSILFMEYGSKKFIATGLQGVYSSKDGSKWEKVMDFKDSYQFHPLLFVNGQFFLTVYEQNKIYTSKDGVNWKSSKYDTNAAIESFIYYKGQYIGISDAIYKSSDGIKWTKLSASPAGVWFRSITTDGKKVVAMGTGGNATDQVVYTSENLSKWTKQDLKSMGHQYYTIYPVKDGFAGLAYSENSSIYSMKSKNGLNWTHKLIGSSSTVDIEGVATNGKRVVAVGGLGNIIYTDNGANWHSANPLPSREIYGRPYFNAVEYGANKFVTVGNDGVYTSKDGLTWTQASAFKNKEIMLTELMWTGKYFIASGQTDGVYYSKDGTSWSKVTSVSKEGHWLMSMVYDGKRIIGAFQIYNKGNQYIQLMSTTNGTSWTKLATLTTMEIELAYNEGSYLAVDPYNVKNLWISKDTKNWTKTNVTSQVKNDDLVTIMTFDKYFVAFNRSLQYIDGEYINNTNYYVSKDGKQWSKRTVPSKQAEQYFGNGQIFDGVKAFGKYLFVGAQGFILSTADLKLEEPIIITVNGAQLKQTAETGRAYIEGGVTYLPLRVIGDALGFSTQWNSKDKSVTLKNKTKSATFTDVQVKNGVSYVPLRKVSEKLGYSVSYKKVGNSINVEIVSKK